MDISNMTVAILDPCQDGMDRIINDHVVLGQVVGELRSRGFDIIVTSVVCDIMHDGHVKYIAKARDVAGTQSVLIVIVESDDLVRKRKGKERPFVPFESRILIVASLRSVGIATIMGLEEEGSFEHVLEILKPDVLVVSNTTADIREEERKMYDRHCRSIQTLDAQGSLSTTDIVAKIRNT